MQANNCGTYPTFTVEYFPAFDGKLPANFPGPKTDGYLSVFENMQDFQKH